LEKLLLFATGSTVIPHLGFSPSPILQFKDIDTPECEPTKERMLSAITNVTVFTMA
jgi:hypothetical protein